MERGDAKQKTSYVGRDDTKRKMFYLERAQVVGLLDLQVRLLAEAEMEVDLSAILRTLIRRLDSPEENPHWEKLLKRFAEARRLSYVDGGPIQRHYYIEGRDVVTLRYAQVALARDGIDLDESAIVRSLISWVIEDAKSKKGLKALGVEVTANINPERGRRGRKPINIIAARSSTNPKRP